MLEDFTSLIKHRIPVAPNCEGISSGSVCHVLSTKGYCLRDRNTGKKRLGHSSYGVLKIKDEIKAATPEDREIAKDNDYVSTWTNDMLVAFSCKFFLWKRAGELLKLGLKKY